MKTASKLATAQGSTLNIYGKIQLFLVPTRTMEQDKLLNKPFEQTFRTTDLKQNIIGIPFITKFIPAINILISKIHIKNKYTRMQNTYTRKQFFRRLNKQPPFFSKFYPIYQQEQKYLKPLSGNVYNFSIKQVHHYDKNQNKQHIFMSDLEMNRFINFLD